MFVLCRTGSTLRASGRSLWHEQSSFPSSIREMLRCWQSRFKDLAVTVTVQVRDGMSKCSTLRSVPCCLHASLSGRWVTWTTWTRSSPTHTPSNLSASHPSSRPSCRFCPLHLLPLPLIRRVSCLTDRLAIPFRASLPLPLHSSRWYATHCWCHLGPQRSLPRGMCFGTRASRLFRPRPWRPAAATWRRRLDVCLHGQSCGATTPLFEFIGALLGMTPGRVVERLSGG